MYLQFYNTKNNTHISTHLNPNYLTTGIGHRILLVYDLLKILIIVISKKKS